MAVTRAAALVVALLTVVLTAAPAPAKSSKVKRLRAQVTALEARLAELERQVSRQAVRLELVPTMPGGFCGDPCTVDSDGDGLGDCEDLCPCDPDHRNSDGDEWPDCMDPCPDDAENACIWVCQTEPDPSGMGVVECPVPCVTPTGEPCEPPPPPPPPGEGECRRTGCSGQLCAGEDVPSTCEWLPEYACYAQAVCERQADGECGWTITPEAAACLANPPPL